MGVYCSWGLRCYSTGVPSQNPMWKQNIISLNLSFHVIFMEDQEIVEFSIGSTLQRGKAGDCWDAVIWRVRGSERMRRRLVRMWDESRGAA